MEPHALPRIDDLLPAEARLALAPIADHRSALRAAERAGIERAAVSRQLEFSTGRWLARGLLAALGAPDVALPRNPDRTPGWPAGWVGSISHSGPLCLAAVAPAAQLAGIGLDLEPDQAVKPGLERMVCFGDELDWVAAAGPAEQGQRCRAVFCVKEAVYKAFHPTTGRVWRFAEVSVEIDLEREAFRARLPGDAPLDVVEGRLLRRSGWLVAGVAWRRVSAVGVGDTVGGTAAGAVGRAHGGAVGVGG